MIKEHHDSEEQHFFQEVNRQWGADTMASSYAEHETFQNGLERFAEYIKSLNGRETEFSGAKLVELIDGFIKPLETHLHTEIDTLLGLSKLENSELVMKLWTESVNKSIKEMSLSDVLEKFPFIVFGHDLTYEGGLHHNFPPAPRVMAYILKYRLFMWDRTFCRYMPCDISGRPQVLYRPPADP